MCSGKFLYSSTFSQLALAYQLIFIYQPSHSPMCSLHHLLISSTHSLTHSVSRFPFLCVQNMDGERKKFYTAQAEATRKVYTGASLEPSLYFIECGCTSFCYDFLRMEASSCVLMNVTIAAQMGKYNRALADYHTKLAVLLPKVTAIVLHNRRTLLPQIDFGNCITNRSIGV